MRTGEALRAPALDPVACWKVERRGEKVVVAGKIERDPLSPSYPAHIDRARLPRDVVIIGAGAAGNAATEMLRRCGYDGRIAVVDDDPGAPYDRPNLSKDYLAGTATEDWIPLRPGGFYENTWRDADSRACDTPRHDCPGDRGRRAWVDPGTMRC